MREHPSRARLASPLHATAHGAHAPISQAARRFPFRLLYRCVITHLRAKSVAAPDALGITLCGVSATESRTQSRSIAGTLVSPSAAETGTPFSPLNVYAAAAHAAVCESASVSVHSGRWQTVAYPGRGALTEGVQVG